MKSGVSEGKATNPPISIISIISGPQIIEIIEIGLADFNYFNYLNYLSFRVEEIGRQIDPRGISLIYIYVCIHTSVQHRVCVCVLSCRRSRFQTYVLLGGWLRVEVVL